MRLAVLSLVTSAAVATAMSATTMASVAVPAVAMTSVPRAVVSMSRTGGVHGGAGSAAGEEGRVNWFAVRGRAEGPGVEPPGLLDRVCFLTGATPEMRIVMDHAAKELVAIGCILGGVEDVLVPELVQVVLAFRVGPGNEHEAGLHLQEGEKADVFGAR